MQVSSLCCNRFHSSMELFLLLSLWISKTRGRKSSQSTPDNLLNSADYAALGGSSKVAAVLLTYPFQVIRARLQQRPSTNGIPTYIDSLHVIRETARSEKTYILFEGLRGFYRGLTANLLKNVPASSITFIVYENVLKLLKHLPPTR